MVNRFFPEGVVLLGERGKWLFKVKGFFESLTKYVNNDTKDNAKRKTFLLDLFYQ